MLFRCVGGSRNPRSLSQRWPSNRSTGIIILLIDIVSLSPRGRPLATNSDKELQRAADLLLFKLPPAAAVQSSGPDPNKSVNYLPAPALPARQNCSSKKIAVATARRPCTCAQANCSNHSPARKRPRASKWARAAGARSHLPIYVQIHANTI